jgi:hypothetical protein
MKNKILEYLNINYPDDKVIDMLDDEISSGNWVDEDWNNEHESEYDWYQDFGNGEAEDAVREIIINELISKFNFTYDSYKIETGEEIYETINDLYDCLNKN